MRPSFRRLRRLQRNVRQFRSPADVLLFCRILAFAAVVPMVTRLPMHRVELIVEPKSPARRRDPALDAKVVRYTEAAMLIGRPLIRRTCLTRGLTRYYFMRRNGNELALVFGMGEIAGQVSGHCWLVRGEEPYLERNDPRPAFTEMYRIGAAV